jgi:phage head maturation protease
METQFQFEGKALSTIELSEGDLLLEGFAVIFAGLDRALENFQEGAFRRACKSFLAGSAPLCFHHQPSSVLGKVLEMSEVPGVGVRIKARVDGAIKDSPTLGPIYHQIRKGTLTGLSMGGFFKRLGNMIVDIDPTELSITACPTHPAPSFSVVEGKALELALVRHELDGLEWLRDQMRARDRAIDDLHTAVSRIRLGMSSP